MTTTVYENSLQVNSLHGRLESWTRFALPSEDPHAFGMGSAHLAVSGLWQQGELDGSLQNLSASVMMDNRGVVRAGKG